MSENHIRYHIVSDRRFLSFSSLYFLCIYFIWLLIVISFVWRCVPSVSLPTSVSGTQKWTNVMRSFDYRCSNLLPSTIKMNDMIIYGLYPLYIRVISSPTDISAMACRYHRLPSNIRMQLGFILWLIYPPRGVRTNSGDCMWDIPNADILVLDN